MNHDFDVRRSFSFSKQVNRIVIILRKTYDIECTNSKLFIIIVYKFNVTRGLFLFLCSFYIFYLYVCFNVFFLNCVCVCLHVHIFFSLTVLFIFLKFMNKSPTNDSNAIFHSELNKSANKSRCPNFRGDFNLEGYSEI